ncbi:hypothetical protein [Nocardia vermiculata]|uniref:Uncharacterized protein n=1 Tax=Nocardia vermiculata TaxID=257274 RepID=A0A846Y554_9NOCA|nr:hypothetical protein [Nocardia vermiculata]NKY53977.1 hypothetical protein [Nocardia vermiculata]
MTAIYREPSSAQLQLWDEPPAVPVEERAPAGYRPGRTRAAARCPSCQHRAASAAEDARMRADMGVLWLHPDPAAPDGVREAAHCRHCQPRQVADTECVRCLEGGPLLADQFAADSAAGRVPAEVTAWLARHGWHTADGPLICPNHHQGQSYRDTKPYRT